MQSEYGPSLLDCKEEVGKNKRNRAKINPQLCHCKRNKQTDFTRNKVFEWISNCSLINDKQCFHAIFAMKVDQ